MFARFSIHADVAASMLRITMSGFYELPDIARFVAALQVEHRKLLSGPNQHLTLVDIREMKIQPQESVDGFQRVLSDPALASRRIAFVVEPGLARAQIIRAATGRPAMFFANAADAERWLLAKDEAVLEPIAASIPPLAVATMMHSSIG